MAFPLLFLDAHQEWMKLERISRKGRAGERLFPLWPEAEALLRNGIRNRNWGHQGGKPRKRHFQERIHWARQNILERNLDSRL